jgi:hypothetical protein
MEPSLAYDRATFNRDNMYRLSDGDQTVRFIGCSDRPAVFNGAVVPKDQDRRTRGNGGRSGPTPHGVRLRRLTVRGLTYDADPYEARAESMLVL